MYRTGKLFRACTKLFIFFHLLIYVISVVEGARDLPNQREIKEAQKIIGRFLRNDAGASWLSGLAKTKSAPLTTEDLMDAIRRNSKKGEKVWKAASILKEASKLQNSEGLRTDSFLGQNENWKNIIADIEKEDDIICLYRKNTEETAKKAEDWQKFLKTVSPGYTVHLAIDTGLKYVICLKKIEIPEEDSIEISSSREFLSTSFPEFTSKIPIIYPEISSSSAMIRPTARKLHSYNERTNFDYGRSDESCEESEEEGIGSESNEDYDYNYDLFQDRRMRRLKNRMNQDSNNGGRDDLVNFRGRSQMGEENLPLNNRGQQNYPYWSTDGRLFPQSLKKDPECDRPIILVVQDKNSQLGCQSSMIPLQKNIIPQHSNLYSRPQLQSSVLPGSPLYPFDSAEKDPRLMEFNNLGKPIRNYWSSPSLKRAQPDLWRNWKSNYKISPDKPSAQIRQGGFTPMLPKFVQRPNVILPSRSDTNYPPRLEIPNIRNSAIPMNGGKYPPRSAIPNIRNAAIPMNGANYPSRSAIPNIRNAAIPMNGVNYPPRLEIPNIRNAAKPMNGINNPPRWEIPNIRNSANLMNGINSPPRRSEVPNVRNSAIPMSGFSASPDWQRNERWRNNLDPRGRFPDRNNLGGSNPLSQLEQQRKDHFLRQSISNHRNSQLEQQRKNHFLRQSISNHRNSQLEQQRKDHFLRQSTSNHRNSQLEQQRKDHFLRQSIPNHLNSPLPPKPPISKPIFAPIPSNPMQFQPPTYNKRILQKPSNIDPRFRGPSIQNSNRMNPQFPNNLQPLQNIRGVPCIKINPNANYPTANNLLEQRQGMLKNWNPVQNNGLCIKNAQSQTQLQQCLQTLTNSCDRPIKMQIVIDGNVQNPSKVSVLTEPQQRVEVVGSRYPVNPYGFNEPFMRSGFEEDDEEEPEDVEVERRMNALEDKSERGKITEMENNSEYDEEDEKDESTMIDNKKLKKEETSKPSSKIESSNSTKENESVEVKEISMRFFDEFTTKPTPAVVKNASFPATTNSTLIV